MFRGSWFVVRGSFSRGTRHEARGTNKGFTLAELMVASAILVILLGAFLTAFYSLLRTANYSQGLSLAYSACLSKLEEMVSHDFSAIRSDYGAGGTPGWTFIPDGLNGMGNITVVDQPSLYGGGEQRVTTNSPMWSGRYGYTSLVYDNKMWVMGGYNGVFLNDVWSSSNGINWTQATAAAGWSGRQGHTSLVYDNKMWVMGGYNGVFLNDVWYSNDGVTWMQAATQAPMWSGRDYHTSLVYNNKMWVMGGNSAGAWLNDVWSSSNGINWTQTTNAAWSSGRWAHTSLVYNNKMWVMGGWNWFIYFNDVWSSSNGINWTRATAAAGWFGRWGHTSLVYDNKMWVMGGYSGVFLNDVWYSAGYDRLLDIIITVCWRQPDGRIFGEDANLDGNWTIAEDTLVSNGRLDSPAQLRVLLSQKNILNLRKTFLGRQ